MTEATPKNPAKKATEPKEDQPPVKQALEPKEAQTIAHQPEPKKEQDLQQSVFIAVVAALASKGTPAEEAAELAKQYAIAAVEAYS